MNTKLLFIAALVLFVLSGLLLLMNAGDKDLPEVLGFFGLACLAGGHAI